MTNEPLPLEIDIADTSQLLEQDTVRLLDCREPPEREFACITPSRWIPMREIPQRLAELVDWQNVRVVVYCHHGGRSNQVASWLRQQGFSQVQSLAGGIDQWSLQQDPQIPRYG